jgi:hypothetical protein
MVGGAVAVGSVVAVAGGVAVAVAVGDVVAVAVGVAVGSTVTVEEGVAVALAVAVGIAVGVTVGLVPAAGAVKRKVRNAASACLMVAGAVAMGRDSPQWLICTSLRKK